MYNGRRLKVLRRAPRMRFRLAIAAVFVFAVVVSAAAQWSPLDPVSSVQKTPTGATVTFKSGGTLKLEVCADSIIHVLYSPTSAFPARKEYVVTKSDWAQAQV